ncbi:MAG TPA: DUF1254 domain-containing protein [Pseudolabrys sp.]|jgi:hypothetical protein|nr:DUF1254 domain-containing protein [Pseudolabrys sp.]
MRRRDFFGLLGGAAAWPLAPWAQQSVMPTTLTAQEAQNIALEAYIYFYPLVIMDVTRKHFTNIEADKKFGRGPMNTFTHARTFPPATFRGATHPNFDTLYSLSWLDLTKGPVVISVPDTHGRYYLLQMLDMWTNTFAGVGKRTTGTDAGNFVVVGPRWQGELPQGLQRIYAPTPFVWVIGRTRTDGPQDYDAVHKVQDGYKIALLSQWGSEPQPITANVDTSVDMETPPVQQVKKMIPNAYFAYAAELLKVNRPQATDQPQLARMKRILGFEVDQSFDPAKADPLIRQALQAAPAAAEEALIIEWPKVGRKANGWVMNTDSGVYGANYLKRASVAKFEIGMNLPEDAIYPDTADTPLDGNNKYVMHFEKGALPPVEEFWSVTIYDLKGFTVPTPTDRYTLGDRSNLKPNPDGSLDIYLQRENPGADKESNWLPTPPQPFSLHARLYSPRKAAIDGTWAMPPVVQVK